MLMWLECGEPAQASSIDDLVRRIAMRHWESRMIKSTARGQARQDGRIARNLTTHSTGARISRSFIEKLPVPALHARPVNSGVRRNLVLILEKQYMNINKNYVRVDLE